MVEGQTLLGMGFSVASTILTNIGILLQKHSADVERGKHLCLRWRFWLGFVLNLGSEAGLTTLALMFAPLAALAPLVGLAVVFNALLARSGLVPGIRETMDYTEWLATALIFGGVTLVAISGPGPLDDDGEDVSASDAIAALPGAFRQPAFIAYASCSAAIISTWLVICEQRCVACLRKFRPNEDSIAAAVGSSFTAAMTSGFSIIFLKVHNPPPLPLPCPRLCTHDS